MTSNELIEQLRTTALIMADTARYLMDYDALDAEAVNKGKEMIGAAEIAEGWADWLEQKGEQ